MPALPRAPPSSSQQPPIVSSFTVATSTAPRTTVQDESDLDSFATSTLARVLSHGGSSLAVKLDWIERLSNPGTPLELMKDASKHLDRPSYDDLLVERHMEGLCPYAACGNAASTPYRSEEEVRDEGRRFKVKLKANGLFDAAAAAPGEDKGAYCSTRCKARSEWYRGILGRNGEGEMLEDVEDRREQVKRSTQELLEEAAATKDAAPPTKPENSSSLPPPDSKSAFTTSLLSTLSIHEKPIPSSAPAAPTPAQAAHDFERPAPPPSASTSTPSASAASTRFPSQPAPRAGSSTALPSSAEALLPFSTASLTRTVLRSTASSAPPRRQPTTGAAGLPPIRFLSEPRMVDDVTGREVEWVGVDEEGESEEVKGWMEEALMIKRMVERGEL